MQGPNRTQERNLIADYIWAHCRGTTKDCYDVAIEIREHWGIRVDHHPVAYVLDAMMRNGHITRDYSGPDKYKIPNAKPAG